MSVGTPPTGPTEKTAVAALLDGIRALLEEVRVRIVSGVAYSDRDVEHRMHEQATLASAQYAAEHMTAALPIRPGKHRGNGHFELVQHALTRIKVDGFYAEFGVFKGASLIFIAGLIDKVIYGFDAFEGLPADWSPAAPKGAFSLGGAVPNIAIPLQNFRIVKGWFAESLPGFLAQVTGPAAFLHIDCHLHQSTKDVLDGLEGRIRPGAVIIFRQYFNYPGWQAHQFKAFQDFCTERGLTYRYLAYTPIGNSVSVIID